MIGTQRGIFFIFLLALSFLSFAQTKSIILKKNHVLVIADSLIIAKNDTTIAIPKNAEYEVYDNKYVLSDGFYDSVYSVAQKSKVTKELYNLLITNKPKENGLDKKEPVRSESYFEPFEGKTITSVKYVSVDLFGGSVNDTTQKAQSNIGRLTNELHKNTSKSVIYKQLLFHNGDVVDPFQIADSERIIRSLPYIEDARIILKNDAGNSNGAQAIVVVKDRFPWTVEVSLNENSAYRLGFANKNILGTGNEFGIGYLHSRNESPMHGFDSHYTIRNIKDSFIDGTVFLSDNYLGKSKGIKFQRKFISPEFRYYGEAIFEHEEPISDLTFADSVYEENASIDRKSYDIWGARSFILDDRKNISVAIRLQHDYFDQRPEVQPDSNTIYHNHHFLISGLSYTKIKFLKTKNILSFNITEDVPIGFVYSILIGKDWTEFGDRDYRGFQTSFSTYNKSLGYFVASLESGYFISQSKKTDNIIEIDARHFTPLINLGVASSRIFNRIHYFNGEQLSIPISQSLAGENRIRNIEGVRIKGNKLLSFTTEYVVFQPWYFYGFRFATYAHAGIGYVEENRIQNPYSNTYYSFGGGVRIRNESLVFDTFEFRLSMFPNAPTEGQLFYFKVTLSAPQFFKNLNVGKPEVVGLD
ncbi:hypothetical protein [Ekhidna sp.]|uniref:hypothetical protein n=1 Tax=Ekhidna sp. TaxID=2608089 RepID=UPI003B503646